MSHASNAEHHTHTLGQTSSVGGQTKGLFWHTWVTSSWHVSYSPFPRRWDSKSSSERTTKTLMVIARLFSNGSFEQWAELWRGFRFAFRRAFRVSSQCVAATNVLQRPIDWSVASMGWLMRDEMCMRDEMGMRDQHMRKCLHKHLCIHRKSISF